MLEITDNTPIAMLTVGQLKEALKAQNTNTVPVPDKRFVYGIPGIMDLFKVSRPIAQQYKDTFLQPAVMQTGRKIVVDVEKALQLFGTRTGGRK